MKTNLFILLALLLFCLSCTRPRDNKPNILLILADDMGWSDIGSYGGEIATPNLDKLAAEGVRFTQMHNTSKCFPSRATLLTGIYAQQNGYDKSYKQPLRHCVTLGEVLHSAGYLTLWAGKHHGVETPVDRGFDHYYGLRAGASNHFNPGPQRPGEAKPAQKHPDRPFFIDHKKMQPYAPPKDYYSTDYFTKYALSWLDEYKDDDRPIFLYLAYTAPHDPLMAWPKDIQKYRGKYMKGYEAIRTARYTRQRQSGLIDERYMLSPETYDPWRSLSDSMKQEEDLKMATYAAMIDRMDQKIGEVLDKLKSTGRLDNTLVLFMSDNGSSAEVVHIPGNGKTGTVGQWTSLGKNWANVSNTPFRYYKNYSFEGGICTPMIAWWPKGMHAKNSLVTFPAHFIDIMPTLVELTGATYPAQHAGEKVVPIQGVSLAPLLRGESLKRDKPLFWQWSKGKAVRNGPWKIVAHGKDAAWELYNMAEDPTEINNLAGVHPDIVTKMDQWYKDWLKDCAQWN